MVERKALKTFQTALTPDPLELRQTLGGQYKFRLCRTTAKTDRCLAKGDFETYGALRSVALSRDGDETAARACSSEASKLRFRGSGRAGRPSARAPIVLAP